MFRGVLAQRATIYGTNKRLRSFTELKFIKSSSKLFK